MTTKRSSTKHSRLEKEGEEGESDSSWRGRRYEAELKKREFSCSIYLYRRSICAADTILRSGLTLHSYNFENNEIFIAQLKN